MTGYSNDDRAERAAEVLAVLCVSKRYQLTTNDGKTWRVHTPAYTDERTDERQGPSTVGASMAEALEEAVLREAGYLARQYVIRGSRLESLGVSTEPG